MRQEAGLCVGTEDECKQQFAAQEQGMADSMTDEQAIKSLDDQFIHDPRSLSPSQVKGLEALSRQPDLNPIAKGRIDSFLEDFRSGTDRLGLDGQLGRPDAPPLRPPDPDDV
jgi:hypothetical protein